MIKIFKIIGHENIISGINKRKANNSFSHAALLSGEDGIGKSIAAKYLSDQIMNLSGRKSVDVIEFKPSKNSFGVDTVRKIIEETLKKPYEGDKKVLILYKCELMTESAQNALLKTIEEPPEGIYLILLTDSLESILDTIKSRCQIYRFTPLKRNEMELYMNNNYKGLEKNMHQAALAFASGIPGRADRFLNDRKLKEIRDVSVSIIKDAAEKQCDLSIKYNPLVKDFSGEKNDFLDVLTMLLRDIIIYKELYSETSVINADKIDDIKDIAGKMSYKKLSSMLKYIEEARINLQSNTAYSVTVSIMLMEFMEV